MNIFDILFFKNQFVAAMNPGYVPGESETGPDWAFFPGIEFDGIEPVKVNKIWLWNSPENGVEIYNG